MRSTECGLVVVVWRGSVVVSDVVLKSDNKLDLDSNP